MKHRPLALVSLPLLAAPALAQPAPRYRQDIRPILAANCFGCHGQDEHKRSAGLRLDEPNRAVVPGDVLASALVQRIRRTDALRMPPADAGHALTTSQKTTLLRWIDAGDDVLAFERPGGFVCVTNLSPTPIDVADLLGASGERGTDRLDAGDVLCSDPSWTLGEPLPSDATVWRTGGR